MGKCIHVVIVFCRLYCFWTNSTMSRLTSNLNSQNFARIKYRTHKNSREILRDFSFFIFLRLSACTTFFRIFFRAIFFWSEAFIVHTQYISRMLVNNITVTIHINIVIKYDNHLMQSDVFNSISVSKN